MVRVGVKYFLLVAPCPDTRAPDALGRGHQSRSVSSRLDARHVVALEQQGNVILRIISVNIYKNISVQKHDRQELGID